MHPLHETQRQRYTNSDKVVAHRVSIIRNYSNCGSQLSASPTLYPPLFIWYPLLFTIIAMAYHGLSARCIVCGAFGFRPSSASRIVSVVLPRYLGHSRQSQRLCWQQRVGKSRRRQPLAAVSRPVSAQGNNVLQRWEFGTV